MRAPGPVPSFVLCLLLLAGALAPGCGREEPGNVDSDEPPVRAASSPIDAEADRPGSADESGETPLRVRARSERVGEREILVQEALYRVKDPAVWRAMRAVPRHRFVPKPYRKYAYENRPLPIDCGQTISQPLIVAEMTEQLRLTPTSKVLEIGTGSGYQAAVLAEITPHVYSIEIQKPLAVGAARTLRALGYDQVTTRHGDGYHGWKEEAPFDAIIVTAAAPHVPPPLVRQLKPGGRLVIPVGPHNAQKQDLMLVTKDEQGVVRTKSLYGCRFVPLTGSLGG